MELPRRKIFTDLNLFQSKNSSSHAALQELQALSPMTLHQNETLVLLTRKSGASICQTRMSMNQGLTKMVVLGIERVEKTLVKMDTDADGQRWVDRAMTAPQNGKKWWMHLIGFLDLLDSGGKKVTGLVTKN
ncbi:hypothetical protein K7X08_027499 [Anisodus acutangulus]|uniref:Uncharacterized protein n=1 Tax=Anisodus acutangulus TaxID=402998 RepID=A0A9Q1MMY4_9SOLA|nr:hypothetical protein K7X08_027499 [Anisodus acutangulus]